MNLSPCSQGIVIWYIYLALYSDVMHASMSSTLREHCEVLILNIVNNELIEEKLVCVHNDDSLLKCTFINLLECVSERSYSFIENGVGQICWHDTTSVTCDLAWLYNDLKLYLLSDFWVNFKVNQELDLVFSDVRVINCLDNYGLLNWVKVEEWICFYIFD